jgi:hypothetical protein
MGGQKISDRGSWIGSSTRNDPLPQSNKTKYYTDSDGAGEVMNYNDTTEAVQRFQKANKAKVNGHKQPEDHRN